MRHYINMTRKETSSQHQATHAKTKTLRLNIVGRTNFVIVVIQIISVSVSVIMHRQRKHDCAAFPCRVCAANCATEQESMQCDGCKCWLHQDCIGMTTSQYVNFIRPHLQFFCRQCVSNLDFDNFKTIFCSNVAGV